jgi:hypothetical protein
MFDVSDRFLHQLAADRGASLQRCGERRPVGSLRRAIGSALVRLGLRPGYNIAPIDSQPGTALAPQHSEGSPSVASLRTKED